MRRVAALVALVGAVAGCGGGSYGPAPQAGTPPPPASVDFTTYTKELLASQSDSALPNAVSVAQFTFHDDDNPDAFASVLPGP